MADCVSPITMEIYWCGDLDATTPTWTDISGTFNSVGNAEQSRMTGQVYAFGDELPCVGYGSREPMSVDFEIIYTEGGTDAFLSLHPYFTDGSDIGVRWHPAGSATGNYYFEADGRITNWVYPGGDADNADPALTGFSVWTDEIDMGTT